MNGYKTFYYGLTWDCRAHSLYEAKAMAELYFKPPKSKRYLISVVLCEKDDEKVTHDTAGV